MTKIWQKRISSYIEADTFTHLIQWISVLCLIPIFIFFIKFKFIFSTFNIILVSIAGISWYIGTLITNRSIKVTDLTLREPIQQTRTVFVFLFSAFFLKEHISLFEYLGGALIFIGFVISSFKERLNYKNLKTDGVFLSLLAAFLVAVSYTFDKYALRFIDVLPWAFMMYMIPSILMVPKTAETIRDIRKQSTKTIVSLFAIILIGSAAYISLIFILSHTNLSRSFPISQLSTVFVFLGGLYLGERKNIVYRAIGSCIAIIGGVFIFLG